MTVPAQRSAIRRVVIDPNVLSYKGRCPPSSEDPSCRESNPPELGGIYECDLLYLAAVSVISDAGAGLVYWSASPTTSDTDASRQRRSSWSYSVDGTATLICHSPRYVCIRDNVPEFIFARFDNVPRTIHPCSV